MNDNEGGQGTDALDGLACQWLAVPAMKDQPSGAAKKTTKPRTARAAPAKPTEETPPAKVPVKRTRPKAVFLRLSDAENKDLDEVVEAWDLETETRPGGGVGLTAWLRFIVQREKAALLKKQKK